MGQSLCVGVRSVGGWPSPRARRPAACGRRSGDKTGHSQEGKGGKRRDTPGPSLVVAGSSKFRGLRNSAVLQSKTLDGLRTRGVCLKRRLKCLFLPF